MYAPPKALRPKEAPRAGRHLNGFFRIVNDVYAEGNADVFFERADDGRHGHQSDCAGVRGDGEAVLVGDQNTVHAAVLQGLEVRCRMLHDGIQRTAERGFAGQSVQVQQCNDGFIGTKQIFRPHGCHLLNVVVP